MLLISILILASECDAYRGRFWQVHGDDEAKLITLLPELLRLREELQQPSITFDNDQTDDEEYDNEWVVKIVGGPQEAKNIAQTVGYRYIAPVLWAEQQRVRKRFKRDDIGADGAPATSTISDNDHYNDMFNDPFWPEQWNLRSSRTVNGELISMNVMEAWKLGYTGKGVVVTIMDDGIQHNHPDIAHNYDPLASYDLNDNDRDPMPTFNDYNRHGTRCAGEVAMTPNNSFCGVGIAYNARIGGIRMLDGKVTDRVEAEALSYNIDHIDIFSASWGPTDDGKTVEGPGRLAQKAILKGIQQGRGGKGAIYVWASGNGGMKDDDCDCDGYMDSIYTFSVSSVTEDGTFPWYAEKCAATLTSTYSNGHHNKRMITTTDIGNKCATDFAGTSASAPMAAAIIALGLEANPSLTWRDVQHIAVWTSDPMPLLVTNEGWSKNARGLLVNSRFGFGIMDAEAFVKAAKDWKYVPEQHACTTIFPTFSKREINDESATLIKFQTDGCEGQKNEVNFLEHVQLVLDAHYPIRGHLSISITSPQGTTAQLLSVRREDKSPAGFRHWPFMSVHTWGENPRGIWQLHVEDKSMTNKAMTGIVNNITLIIYGTAEEPKHYEKGRHYKVKDETKSKSQQVDPNVPARGILKQAERIVSGASVLKSTPVVLDRIVRFIDGINQWQSRILPRSYRRRALMKPNRRRPIFRRYGA